MQLNKFISRFFVGFLAFLIVGQAWGFVVSPQDGNYQYDGGHVIAPAQNYENYDYCSYEILEYVELGRSLNQYPERSKEDLFLPQLMVLLLQRQQDMERINCDQVRLFRRGCCNEEDQSNR